ncbi:MAG: hypothetical protein AB8H79_21720 [Myxococcota bacterium]
MRVPSQMWLLSALALSAVACGDYVSSTGPEHCGVVQDEIWGKDLTPHDVTCDVTINGSLVIGPDTRVRFAPGATLIVKGSLSVEGVEGKPVLFEAIEEGGGWVGVRILPVEDDDDARPDPFVMPNRIQTGEVNLTHLNIIGAGLSPDGAPFVPAALIVERSSVTLGNVTIEDSRKCGVSLGPSGEIAADSQAITITSPLEAPICAHVNAVGTLPGEAFALEDGAVIDLNGDTLTGRHTWSNFGVPYVLADDLDLIRGSLTLGAGVALQINPQVKLTVGGTASRLTYGVKANRSETGPLELDEAARLHMAGTEAEPVTVSSSLAFGENSLFDRIEINGNSRRGATASALLENVDISLGGDGITTEPATLSLVGDAQVKVTNVTIRDGGGAGVSLADTASFTEDSSGLIITGNAYPAVVEPDGASSLPSTGSVYTGNTQTPRAGERESGDRIYVKEGAFTQSGRVRALGVPYLIEGDVEIRGPAGVELTIEDEVDLQIAPGAVLEFGTQGSAAAVIGEGGAGVNMTPAVPGTQWEGVVFGSSLVAPSRITNLTVAGAGGNPQNAAVEFLASNVAADGLTIDGAEGPGLRLVGRLGDGSKDLVVRNAKGPAIFTLMDSAGSIPAEGADLADNDRPWVEVDGVRITTITSWANLGVPYHADDIVTVLGRDDAEGTALPARLTLEPGVEFKFERTAGLRTRKYEGASGNIVHGTVEMIGTAEEPIILGAIFPEEGWSSLELNEEDLLDDPAERSVLDHVRFQDAGAIFAFGALEMKDSTPTLSNITIADAFRYGISLGGDAFVGPRSGDPIRYGCEEFDLDSITFEGEIDRLLQANGDPRLIDFRIWVEDCSPE